MNFIKHCENIKNENVMIHKNLIEELYLLLKSEGNNNNVIEMSKDLKLIKIKDSSFRLPDKYENRINRIFISLGKQYNYKVKFIEVLETKEYFTEFETI